MGVPPVGRGSGVTRLSFAILIKRLESPQTTWGQTPSSVRRSEAPQCFTPHSVGCPRFAPLFGANRGHARPQPWRDGRLARRSRQWRDASQPVQNPMPKHATVTNSAPVAERRQILAQHVSAGTDGEMGKLSPLLADGTRYGGVTGGVSPVTRSSRRPSQPSYKTQCRSRVAAGSPCSLALTWEMRRSNA